MTQLVLLAAIVTALHGGYAVAEVALTTASATRLDELATRGDRDARVALDQIARWDRLLAACLVGTTLCAIVALALWGLVVEQFGAPPWAVVLVYGPVAAWIGALLPRVITSDTALSFAGPSAQLVRGTQVLLAPLVYGVEAWARAMSVLFGSTRGTALTRQEIVLLLDDPREIGIDPHEQAMIRRVFALPEIAVSECMTPLVQVDFVRTETSIRDAVKVAVKGGHTRLPVAEGRVDHIVGLVHARDLLFAADADRPVKELMRKVRYVPEKKRMHELIHEMRRDRDAMVVLVDEYGGSVGIVTIEDLLEEIIGEIRDERDRAEHALKKISDHEWRVDGRVEVEVLAREIGRPIPKGDYETVAGLVLAQLGHIPRAGEVAHIGDVRLVVEDASDRAVRSVIVALPR